MYLQDLVDQSLQSKIETHLRNGEVDQVVSFADYLKDEVFIISRGNQNLMGGFHDGVKSDIEVGNVAQLAQKIVTDTNALSTLLTKLSENGINIDEPTVPCQTVGSGTAESLATDMGFKSIPDKRGIINRDLAKYDIGIKLPMYDEAYVSTGGWSSGQYDDIFKAMGPTIKANTLALSCATGGYVGPKKSQPDTKRSIGNYYDIKIDDLVKRFADNVGLTKDGKAVDIPANDKPFDPDNFKQFKDIIMAITEARTQKPPIKFGPFVGSTDESWGKAKDEFIDQIAERAISLLHKKGYDAEGPGSQRADGKDWKAALGDRTGRRI